MDVVAVGEDDAEEVDAGVAVCIDVDGGDFFEGYSTEESDGEGWARASDTADGDNDEFGLGQLVIDDGAECDVDRVGFEVSEQSAGDVVMDGEVAMERGRIKGFDEGFGIEETDAANA